MKGAKLIAAHLKGAKLDAAHLERADLSGAHLDDATDLTGASLHGAAIRDVNETTIAQLRPVWGQVFADGSVPVPLDDPDRPAHWPRQKLGLREFNEEWHRWCAKKENYAPPEDPEG